MTDVDKPEGTGEKLRIGARAGNAWRRPASVLDDGPRNAAPLKRPVEVARGQPACTTRFLAAKPRGTRLPPDWKPTADDPASQGLGLLGRPALGVGDMKHRISGKDATDVAMEAAKRGPIRVEPSPDDDSQRAIGSQGALPPSITLTAGGPIPLAPPPARRLPCGDRCFANVTDRPVLCRRSATT
jgi:hypothetical protein